MLCKGQLTYEECPWFEPFLKVVTALFVDRVLSTKRKRHAQTEWPHWGSLCTSCFTARCNQCDSIVWSGTLLLFKVPLGSCLHHFENNHPYIRYRLQYACHMERVQSERVVRKVLSTHKFRHITRENNLPNSLQGVPEHAITPVSEGSSMDIYPCVLLQALKRGPGGSSETK